MQDTLGKDKETLRRERYTQCCLRAMVHVSPLKAKFIMILNFFGPLGTLVASCNDKSGKCNMKTFSLAIV